MSMITLPAPASIAAQPVSSTGVPHGRLSIECQPLVQPSALAAEWQDLERRADGAAFTSWNWLRCWLASFPRASRPWLLTVRDQQQLVGAGVFGRTRSWPCPFVGPTTWRLHASGCQVYDDLTIEYNDLLVDRGQRTRVYEAASQFLLSDSRSWSKLVLPGLAPGSGLQSMVNCLPPGIEADGIRRRTCYGVRLDALRASGADYLATLSHKTRGQIRKSMRLYEARGPLTIQAARDPAERLNWFREFVTLHQAHWQKRNCLGAFAAAGVRRFHEELLGTSPEGSVDLLRVQAGTSTIGFVYALPYRGHVAVYQSAFHYEDDWRLKPGLVSHAMAVEWYRERGAAVYDLMAGDSRYKQSLGVPVGDLAWITLRRQGFYANVETLVRHALRTLNAEPTSEGASWVKTQVEPRQLAVEPS